MHRSTFAWLLVLGLALASVVLSFVRLERLPSLPVLVGPDMNVRALKSHPSVGKKSVLLERDDKVVAIQSRGVDDLRDFHAVLSHLDYSTLKITNAGTGAETRQKVITYQIVRPLHRFNVLLQGDSIDPSGLPPGVEPTDLLVELDGRPLQPAIGPEGLRSIISSRPEAFLVFERKNAVFTGKIALPLPRAPQTIMLMFGVAFLLLLCLWRFYHQSLNRMTALAVGFETLAFSWTGMMIFQYQWLLADYILAYVTIFALVMMRPLGIMARTLAAQAHDNRTWSSLVLGVTAAGVVCLMLSRGTLPNVELALQLAALLAGFFVIFEVVLTGLSEDSGKLLGERSIYLAGIILFVLLASLLSWGMDEQAFREDRWRWFACIVMALVWFGDILLCFRGMPGSQFAELADEEERYSILWSYLEELQEVYPGLSIQLLFHRNQSVYSVERQAEGLSISPTDEPIVDAVSILVQEGARVPLSSLENGEVNPMMGIAETMGIEMAFVMSPPRQSIHSDQCDIVFLAKRYNIDEPLKIEIGDEDLDFVQSRMSALVWSTAVIEALNTFMRDTSADQSGAVTVRPGPTKLMVETLEQTQAQVGRLERDYEALNTQLDSMRQWYRPVSSPGEGAERLIESELVDALLYLFEDQGPVVLGGDHGVGKKFVARVGHQLDEQRQSMPCIAYDASEYEESDYVEHFASTETQPSLLMSICVGGSLIIEHAEFLGNEALELLLDEAEQASVRVYLCYVAFDAEARSVLLGLDEPLFDALESREIVIPSFKARKSIQRSVLLHLLDDAAYHHHKAIENISPSAMKALLGYSFPGQLLEARTLLDVAVRRCSTPVLEVGTLPSEIRRSQSSY